MNMPDTPLFVKTHDFILWLLRHTQRFPKNLSSGLSSLLQDRAWYYYAVGARSADRGYYLPALGYEYVGFRVVAE